MSPRRIPRTIGRYSVVDELGYGGMGMVYRGHDPRIGRQVAIKLLRIVSDDALHDRFLQEARSAGNLKHPNIVTIYDFGEHEGQPFIVMEFVEGATLAQYIKDRTPLSLSRKLELMDRLADGLDYAHGRSVIHRDIKPANLMIDGDGELKILDFGIARVSDSGLTQTGAMMGTPNYMSPEQVEGSPVDPRSDIFSVGLVFYELLSGQQAFRGDTAHQVLNAIVHSPAAPLQSVCPGLDPALYAIVGKAIEKDPARRYQNLTSFAADLAACRQRLAPAGAFIAEPTIKMTPAPATPTPRSGTDRAALAKRRAERVDQYLEQAARALQAGKAADALEACEQAALLNPDDPRVIDRLDAARAALDREQAQARVVEAQRALDSGDLDLAASLVGQALGIAPDSAEARKLGADIDERRRQLEQERRRQQAIADALTRARESFAAGRPEATIRAASEILIHDPAHAEAHELSRQALAALEEQRQRQQRDRAAQAAVDEQKRAFAEGDHHGAIAALERYAPSHPLVEAALGALRQELADIERRAHEEAERRQREQEEADRRRQAQEQWAAQQLTVARDAIARKQFAGAIAALEHVQSAGLATPESAALLQEARAAEAASAAAQERAARDRAVIDRARTALREGRPGDARDLIARHALAHESPADWQRECREIVADIEEALKRTEMERRASEAAAQERERQREAAALEREQARKQATEEAAARQRADDERQRARHAEATAAALQAAGACAERGDFSEAIAQAERITFAEQYSSPALDAVKRRRLALLAEWRAAVQFEAVRRALARGKPAEARTALDRARAIDPTNPRLTVLAQDIADAEAAAAVDIPIAALPPEPPPEWNADASVTLEPEPARQESTYAEIAATKRSSTWTLAIAAAALLVVAGAVWQWTRSAPASGNPGTSVAGNTQSQGVGTPATTTQSAPGTGPPAPTTPPPTSPPPTLPPTGATPAPDVEAVRLHQRVGRALAANDLNAALAALTQAGGPLLDDPAVQGDVDQLLSASRSQSTRALTRARQGSTGSGDFKTGVARRSEAEGLERGGRKIDASRAYLASIQLLDRAAAAPAPETTVARGQAPPPSAGGVTPDPPQRPPEPIVTPAPPPTTEPPRPAPPPVEPRPAPPATTPPAPVDPAQLRANDERAIRDTLAQYVAAYQRLDTNALRSVWPSAPANLNLSKIRSYEIELRDPRITVQGNTATVVCTRRVRARMEVGEAQDFSARTEFTLRRSSGAWVIDRVQ